MRNVTYLPEVKIDPPTEMSNDARTSVGDATHRAARSEMTRKESRKADRKLKKIKKNKLLKREVPDLEQNKKLNLRKIKRIQAEHGIKIPESSQAAQLSSWSASAISAGKSALNYFYESVNRFYHLATDPPAEQFSLEKTPADAEPLKNTALAIEALRKDGFVVLHGEGLDNMAAMPLNGVTFIHLEFNHDKTTTKYQNFYKACFNRDKDGKNWKRFLIEAPDSKLSDPHWREMFMQKCDLPIEAGPDLRAQFKDVCVLIDDEDSRAELEKLNQNAMKSGEIYMKAMEREGLKPWKDYQGDDRLMFMARYQRAAATKYGKCKDENNRFASDFNAWYKALDWTMEARDKHMVSKIMTLARSKKWTNMGTFGAVHFKALKSLLDSVPVIFFFEESTYPSYTQSGIRLEDWRDKKSKSDL